MLVLCVWTPLLLAWALSRYQAHGLEVTTVFVYHFLRLMPRYRLFAYLHVLLHKEGHSARGFFKNEWLNFGVMHWFVGLFFGAVPYSYPMAHNKIHHAYDNDLDDVHTNLDLDRSTGFKAFVYYMPRFALYWAGITPAIKFYQKRQWAFLQKMCLGMAVLYGLWALSWRGIGAGFTLAYLMFPFTESVVFFGGISYLWHALCDPRDLNNPYVTSVTIIRGQDNIWNEDFHVVHHTKPSAHWTDYPKHYEDDIDEYRKYKATVFRDCEEGMLLYWLLGQRWDDMADHFVDLDGKMTHEEKKALCLERLRSRLCRPENSATKIK
jgi:fatty acid desaturase